MMTACLVHGSYIYDDKEHILQAMYTRSHSRGKHTSRS